MTKRHQRPLERALLLILIALFTGCTSDRSNSTSLSSSADGNDQGIVLLRYVPGSEATEQREAGFLETLDREFPELRVISSDQYAGTTAEASLEKSQQLLLDLGDRATGIFCPCEPAADGMFRALDQANKLGAIPFVSFDPNPRLADALKAGKLQGIVLQDPVGIGYLAVKTMANHLNGDQVDARISTGESVATLENLHTEEIQRLLSPELFSGNEFSSPDAKYTIAVVPKGTTHEFWRSVHFGARKAAEELGNVNIIWKGPISEGDREGQINVVQDLITRGVDGICLAPLDSQALVSVVKEAQSEGIPTVIFDSDLADQGDAKVSYVATDNYAGGALAARRLAAAILEQQAAQSSGK